MARLPKVTREQLNPEDQPIFDRIAESRGQVRGPYGVLLHSPKAAACVADLGAYVRFQCSLSEALREVVTLATTKEANAQYAFTAHVSWARKFNVSEATIDAIRTGEAPRGLSGDEAIVVRYTQELLRNHQVSDTTFNAALERFGPQGVVDLTVLIGHFFIVGHVLNAFEVELDPSVRPELPVATARTR